LGVGAVAPQSDFLAAVWRMRWLALAAAVGALCLAVILAAALARRVSRPVHALIGSCDAVGDGDLESKRASTAAGNFASFPPLSNRMIGDLRDRLRLRHSLDVAMDVHSSCCRVALPSCRIRQRGSQHLHRRKQAGLLDFLVVDEPVRGNVLVAWAMFMGHGVAAALVMRHTRRTARSCRRHRRPGGSDGPPNRMIAADCKASRFMTMHLGMLDVQQRIYRWASAGHDAPLIYDPALSASTKRKSVRCPLGVMESTPYEEQTLGPLKPGQILVLGTDGVLGNAAMQRTSSSAKNGSGSRSVRRHWFRRNKSPRRFVPRSPRFVARRNQSMT